MSTNSNWLAETLERIRGARVAVVGDFCLDAYWFIEPGDDEISVETGLPIRRVRSQRYTPGGAGNVTANLAALGLARVTAVGVVGQDLFGDELLRALQSRGVDTSGLFRGQADWQTFVYSKPTIGDTEQNRIDFGAFNEPSDETVAHVTAALEDAARTHDAIVVNQQIARPLCDSKMIAAINKIAAAHPDVPIIVDTRDRASEFEAVTLKLNASEAQRVLTGRRGGEPETLEEVRELVRGLQVRTGRPAFITRGERGLAVADGRGKVFEIPGIAVPPPIDIVGAGDTTLSALSAVLAVDRSADAPRRAAQLANIASSIVLKKLHVTGTASPDEILAVGPVPDYIYQPELAASPRAARYVDDSEIEIVEPLPEKLQIKHAIFDHDGTLSTLREGWEKIMEPMMVKAILGPLYKTASEQLFGRVSKECREFIDRTTGIQTLVQMQGLVEVVRRFGFVPEEEILDHFGYKRIYNDELLKMVRERVAKLNRGEVAPEDFQIKNAALLLRKLHDAGVTLYLASGTDVEDVIAEAKAMGYADLFGDRIYGAVGDVNVEAKKMVLERIIRENGLSGSEFVTFGDGPVEIRETRRRGGVTVGVASDEVRRFGLNASKRKRLIRAGADVVVPDFSQLSLLLQHLQLSA